MVKRPRMSKRCHDLGKTAANECAGYASHLNVRSADLKEPFILFLAMTDCDNEFIGQTKRQFGTRLKEH